IYSLGLSVYTAQHLVGTFFAPVVVWVHDASDLCDFVCECECCECGVLVCACEFFVWVFEVVHVSTFFGRVQPGRVFERTEHPPLLNFKSIRTGQPGCSMPPRDQTAAASAD